MDLLASVLLGAITEAVAGALVSEGTVAARAWLRRENSRRALQAAIGRALLRYMASQPERKLMARPLLRRNSLLASAEIAGELAKLVDATASQGIDTAPGLPNAALIGRRWRDELDDSPAWRDFTTEAELLIEYVRTELQTASAVDPQPQHDAALAAAGEATAADTEKLNSVMALMDSPFAGLVAAYAQANAPIRDQIRDFSFYIGDKINGFAGRQFLFDEIQAFLEHYERGYFILMGDPGIGKTALMAKLVQDYGWIHHFNISTAGINKTSDFLGNVCAQLIARYGLNYSALPAEAAEDNGFLNRLLHEVAERLLPGERCVIAVDALDEARQAPGEPSPNILCLPSTLPRGIFVVASSRREHAAEQRLRIDMVEQTRRDLQQDEAGNQDDVARLLKEWLLRAGIQAYVRRQQLTGEAFVDYMVAKAQGNFMYLRYVLPEIERGAYANLALDRIPSGLENYYEDHWRRIRQRNALDWFDHKLPVVVALTIAEEPVSIDLLAEFAQIQQRSIIYAVLEDFDQFLYKTDMEYQGRRQRRYRWYHASFFQFIAAKQEVAEERVNTTRGREQAEQALWENLYGPQTERLYTAILAAFNREEMRRILRTCMDVNFEHVVAEQAFQEQAFELIEWARRTQKLPALIHCLQSARPDNRELAAL